MERETTGEIALADFVSRCRDHGDLGEKRRRGVRNGPEITEERGDYQHSLMDEPAREVTRDFYCCAVKRRIQILR